MGNTLNCCQFSRSVKVYGDKGRLLNFSRPVSASKLMREHPDHLVVYNVVNRRKGNALGVDFKNHVRIRVCRPNDVLRTGKVYFLVHIPEQYTAKFAKYFNRQRASAYSSPSASPLSMCNSAPGSPLSVYDSPAASPRLAKYVNRERASTHSSPSASPLSMCNSTPGSPVSVYDSPAASPRFTASPKRSFYHATASPLATYVPSPLSGSTREMTRPANQQPLRNAAPSRRIQSPARLGTLIASDDDLMRSIVNQHFQRDQIKSVPSPARLGASIQERANQQFQRHPGRLVQSPGRPGSNSSSTKDTMGSILQSRLAQSPGRPVLPSTRRKDTLGNIIRQNHEQQGRSPSQFNQSPGRSTQDTLRNILKQQQRGSSMQYPQRGSLCFSKSPRRSGKGGAGKVSRPRRAGSRSPHRKAALLRSPVRSVQPVAVNKHVNISWLFSREHAKRVESNDGAPPQPRAPPPVLGGPGRRRMLPLLLRNRSVHYPGWTPALQSISENSPDKGTAASLTKGSTPGSTPFHMQMMHRTQRITRKEASSSKDLRRHVQADAFTR